MSRGNDELRLIVFAISRKTYWPLSESFLGNPSRSVFCKNKIRICNV